MASDTAEKKVYVSRLKKRRKEPQCVEGANKIQGSVRFVMPEILLMHARVKAN